jgi:hypothetical protein
MAFIEQLTPHEMCRGRFAPDASLDASAKVASRAMSSGATRRPRLVGSRDLRNDRRMFVSTRGYLEEGVLLCA